VSKAALANDDDDAIRNQKKKAERNAVPVFR